MRAENMTAMSGGTSSGNVTDLPAYLRDLHPEQAKVTFETAPRCEVRIVRDEILDGHSRIAGYRFRAEASGDGKVSPAYPVTKLNALKDDHLASFAQHRMAVVPIDAEEWRAFDYRQFATSNTVFHVALPDEGGTAAWLQTLGDIRASGAGVALNAAATEPEFAAALQFANLVFLKPDNYFVDDRTRLIADLHGHPGIAVAAEGVLTWSDYRDLLEQGIDFCLGEFTAVPYERDAAHEQAAVDSVLNCKLVQFTWYRAFECGNAEIDRDHQRLFELANELLNGIIAGKPAGQLSEAVDKLMLASRDHFETEEAVLRTVGYSHLTQHAALHRSLLNKAAKLVAEFKAGKTAIGPVFQFLAEDLIVRHMLGADREFFPLFEHHAEPALAPEDR